MTCSDVRSRMSAVLDQRTSREERAVIERHLRDCRACRVELAQLEAVDATLRAAAVPEPPAGYHEGFWSRLSMKLDDEDKGDAPKEDSGLIEIRAMASRDLLAQEAAKKREEEEAAAMVTADIPAAVGQPVIVTPPKTVTEKKLAPWVVPVAAVGGLAVVAAVVFVVLLAGRGQGGPEAGTATSAAAPSTPAAAPWAPATPVGGSASAPASVPAEPAVAVAQVEKGAPHAAAGLHPAPAREREEGKPAPGRRAAGTHHATGAKARPAEKPAKPAAEPAAAPAALPRPAKAKSDDLDALLREGAVKQEEKKSDADEELPERLGPREIKSGMNGVKSQVYACYQKYNVPGYAKVTVTIARSGKVVSVQSVGEFAGTPTGNCVTAAVKAAAFPQFKGKPLTIGYTFLLR